MKLSKRKKEITNKLKINKIFKNKQYSVEEAISFLKNIPKLKFKKPESLDVSIKLGVDPTKSDQMVRSSSSLPHGTGKKVTVAVFADGEDEKKALKAGADRVGMDDLHKEIKSKIINYDVIIARLDTIKHISDLGPVLGPRGLMPNIKMGTLTANVEASVLNVKSGQVNYKSEKNGIIHCSIGKIDFSQSMIKENLEKLLSDIIKLKPVTSKGIFIKKIVLSTTMGPGISVKKDSLKI